MTRFEMEISGKLGEFWKKDAEKRVAKAVESVKDMNIDENGVATWKSNGHCLMDDYLELLEYGGVKEVSRENTKIARDKETAEFLKNYRHEPTEEEMLEMRAAFGEGTVVVDVLSGKRYAV